MKYLNTYKLFESGSQDELSKRFGITEAEAMDIMQDSLDSFPGTEFKIDIQNDTSYIGIDYFIVWINSNTVFNDTSFKEMVPDIDSKFGIYGLEVFYAAPLSNRSLGTNLWIKRIGDKVTKNFGINKVPKIELRDDRGNEISDDGSYGSEPPEFMQEGLFSSPDKDIDMGTLKDILDTDIDGLKYMGVNISSDNISLKDAYYKSDRHGHPKLKRETWFNNKFKYSEYSDGDDVEFAQEPDGNFRAFIDRGINRILTTINSGNYNKGIEMTISNESMEFDIREAFQLIYYVYNSINKDRLREYGIGCCLFSPKMYRKETYTILFYPL